VSAKRHGTDFLSRERERERERGVMPESAVSGEGPLRNKRFSPYVFTLKFPLQMALIQPVEVWIAPRINE